VTQKGYKPKQAITHFYCRPCAEYHPKEHPHYRAMKRRKAERRKANEAETVTSRESSRLTARSEKA
jgi:hypothetical protein